MKDDNKNIIRKAAPDDLHQIQYLLKENKLPFSDLNTEKLNHFIIINDPTDNIIGVIGIEPYSNFGLLRSLSISKNYQNQGYGKKLIYELENYAKELGIKEIYLLTQTAEMFFKNLNYEIISREKSPGPIKNTSEFKDICPSNSTCMKKILV